MGAFYGSVHLQTNDAAAVRDAVSGLAKRKRKFLVSPVNDGWIAVYPSDHGQDEQVSKAVAKKLDCPVLHVAVHDDDVFFYSFYRGGKLIDRFNSCPDYFGKVSAREEKSLRGKPERLADLRQNPGDLDKLEALMDAMVPRAEGAHGPECGHQPHQQVTGLGPCGEPDTHGHQDERNDFCAEPPHRPQGRSQRRHD